MASKAYPHHLAGSIGVTQSSVRHPAQTSVHPRSHGTVGGMQVLPVAAVAGRESRHGRAGNESPGVTDADVSLGSGGPRGWGEMRLARPADARCEMPAISCRRLTVHRCQIATLKGGKVRLPCPYVRAGSSCHLPAASCRLPLLFSIMSLHQYILYPQCATMGDVVGFRRWSLEKVALSGSELEGRIGGF